MRWKKVAQTIRAVAIAASVVALNGCALLGLEDEPSATDRTAEPVVVLPVHGLAHGLAPGMLARVKGTPRLEIKPGDARALPDLARNFEPGWSIENRGRVSGVLHNGKRLDPAGLVHPVLLRQALARVAREAPVEPPRHIAVVDFSLPADKPRWFFVDLATGAVSAKYVSHGHAKRLCRSGGCGPHAQAGFSLNVAAVSAAANTDATSLGLYRVVGQRAAGKFPGPAIVLAGLDPSNASAQARGIIIHQNPRYFDPKRGLFGRSQGCFVFGPDDLPAVAATLAPGSLIYAGMAPRAAASAGGRAAASMLR